MKPTASAISSSGIKSGPRTVRCPACGGKSIYAESNAYRPFCSARCKGVDLGAWASESYAVPEHQPPTDPRFEES